LRQTPADAGYCVQMICYVPICRRIEKDGFGLPLDGQDQRPASLPYPLQQPRASLQPALKLKVELAK